MVSIILGRESTMCGTIILIHTPPKRGCAWQRLIKPVNQASRPPAGADVTGISLINIQSV